MKVTQELLTVIPEPATREISLLLAGLRITMKEDEARMLAKELNNGISRMVALERAMPSPQEIEVPTNGALPVPIGKGLIEEREKEKVASGIRSILGKIQ